MLRIYSISDAYIDFLRQDPKLWNVTDGKPGSRAHTRKYLGVVLEESIGENTFHYFVPFSSPKKSDYKILRDGTRLIRKSIVPIIRMTTRDTKSGREELKGTLKLSNMIPVPASELKPYIIGHENDENYKIVVQKEYAFIRSHAKQIQKNARILYNQKTREHEYYPDGDGPGYLKSTVDFKYAEQKCLEYQREKGLKQEKKPKLNLDKQIKKAEDKRSR